MKGKSVSDVSVRGLSEQVQCKNAMLLNVLYEKWIRLRRDLIIEELSYGDLFAI